MIVILTMLIIYTGTFDIQKGAIAVKDPTIGQICFMCIFVAGSLAHGCYIEYLCMNNHDGFVNISRSFDDVIVMRCEQGVYITTCNISFFDIDDEFDSSVDNQTPAYQIFQQNIQGLSSTTLSSSCHAYVSHTTSLLSPTVYESPSEGSFLKFLVQSVHIVGRERHTQTEKQSKTETKRQRETKRNKKDREMCRERERVVIIMILVNT